MTKFEINRPFDHKAFGRIGIVEMTAEVGSLVINGQPVPATSVEYLLNFALQNLQDAYASSKSETEAKAAWQKKLDRLLEGTIGVRMGSSGVNAELKTRRAVLGEILRKTEAGKAAWKAHEDDRDEWLDAIFDKQAEDKQAAIMATVAARIAEAQAKAKQAKEMASGIEL